MTDIQTRHDIETLVNQFYKKVIEDDLIGDFFTRVVKLDWEIHIPIMYDFWESMLLGKATYKGNPMIKHIQLDQKMSLNPEHFERWLSLWEQTIREHFAGEKTEEAIKRARHIAELMKFKIKQQHHNNS